MKKTLQDQYLLIKEGKGHVGVFLTEAKRQFPDVVRNAATFEEAAASLITKNIITEHIVSLGPINSPFDAKKKESYELAFESFLAEAKKKKENKDESVKAEEKKVSKKVEEDASHNFDNSDEKNPDNMIFDQIMMGYYAEMKDPKNADKTMQELKDMVFKNLSKDPIHYTKDGQFGVKGLGYTTEAPGLGTPKEAKGKYKASGYGDLNEGMFSSKPLGDVEGAKEDTKKAIKAFLTKNTQFKSVDNLTDKELLKALEGFARNGGDELSPQANKTALMLYKIAKPLLEGIGRVYPDKISGEYEGKPVITPGVKLYDLLQNILDIAVSENDFIHKVIYAVTDETSNISKEDELKLRNWYKRHELNLAENKLRKVIREMVDAELEEATAMTFKYVPRKSDKEREDRDPTDKYLTFDKDFEKDQVRKGNIILKPGDGSEDKIFITKVLHANLGPSAGNAELRRHLMDRTNLEPAVLGGKEVWKIKGAKINSKGNVSVFVPVETKSMESLKESIDKELAAINKEAEHEIIASKLEKVQALIDKKQSQISRLDEDEDMKDLTDAKKVKEISKDIKALEKAKAKLEKMASKKGTVKKAEVIDEMADDDVEDNYDVLDDENSLDVEYIEDANDRQDKGQKIDSILSNYNNLSFNKRVDLRRDLEARKEEL
jgi:hypothetical protein